MSRFKWPPCWCLAAVIGTRDRRWLSHCCFRGHHPPHPPPYPSSFTVRPCDGGELVPARSDRSVVAAARADRRRNRRLTNDGSGHDSLWNDSRCEAVHPVPAGEGVILAFDIYSACNPCRKMSIVLASWSYSHSLTGQCPVRRYDVAVTWRRAYVTESSRHLTVASSFCRGSACVSDGCGLSTLL